MTAQQRTEHMGVIALTEVIEKQRKLLRVAEYDAAGEDERRIEAQIAALQARLATIRASRVVAGAALAELRDSIEKKERLLALCREDDRVAQAVWMQLLVQRSPGK